MKTKRWVGSLAIALVALTYLLAHKSSSAGPAPTAYQFGPPVGWIPDEDQEMTKSWVGDPEQKQLIILTEDTSIKGEVPQKNDAEFIDMVKTASEIPNWIARISDWKIEKLERTAVTGGQRLTLTGTYLTPRHELVRFEEWKYYLKDGFAQISYRELAGSKARTREQVAEILRRYRPFGI